MTQHFHEGEEEEDHSGGEPPATESDALQEQVAATVNTDPNAQFPLSREDEAFEDLERGLDRSR